MPAKTKAVAQGIGNWGDGLLFPHKKTLNYIIFLLYQLLYLVNC